MLLINVLGLQLDGWAALNVALQFVLPLLVGLVTTKLTGRSTQFILLAVLTLAATVGAQAMQAHAAGLPLNLVQVLVVAIVNFTVSVLSHYNVWKPIGLTDLLLSMLVKAPEAPVQSFPVPDPSAPISPASPVPAVVPDVAPAPAAPVLTLVPAPAQVQPAV
jgi:hypothetical protein